VRQRLLVQLPTEHLDFPLDQNGAFFAWTVRKGSSDVPHRDSMDDPKGYAFLLPFGDFTGANIALPTLKMEIPLKKGQMLALNAHILPHFATAVKGQRYMLTCFMDKNMAATSRDIMLDANIHVSELDFD
jgi:hypothetical protein